MKILLTSAGITNKSIEKALFELAGKPANKTKVAYIPTAANVFGGDKSWMEKEINYIKGLGMKVSTIDISLFKQEEILKRFDPMDVLFFEGGSEFYLMKCINSTISEYIPNLLKTKVWVGVSAGSMVLGPTLSKISEQLYGEEEGEYRDMEGLGLLDFNILPHLNSLEFFNMTSENIKHCLKDEEEPFYAIDDDTAIKIDGDKMEIISEGKWEKFN